jgi:hypothetical protein
MDEDNINEEGMSVDVARRRLLKIGIYAAPAIMFLGKVRIARASTCQDQNSQGNDDCQGNQDQQ